MCLNVLQESYNLALISQATKDRTHWLGPNHMFMYAQIRSHSLSIEIILLRGYVKFIRQDCSAHNMRSKKGIPYHLGGSEKVGLQRNNPTFSRCTLLSPPKQHVAHGSQGAFLCLHSL